MNGYRCMAEGRDGDWYAIYVDLDIAVQGRSFPEVHDSLEQAIETYLERVSGIDAMRGAGVLDCASLIDLFTRLIDTGYTLRVLYVTGHWLDVDNAADLAAARSFL